MKANDSLNSVAVSATLMQSLNCTSFGTVNLSFFIRWSFWICL